MKATEILYSTAPERSDVARTSIPPAWSPFVRAFCSTFVIVITVLFVAALVVGYGQLRQVCSAGFCHPAQLSPAQASINQHLGLSLEFYAVFTTATYLVFGSIGIGVGTIIYWHRSGDWMALFLALVLLGIGVGALPTLASLDSLFPPLRQLTALLRHVSLGAMPVILFIFPDGRFVPRWSRLLAFAWVIYSAYMALSRPIPVEGIASGPPSLFGQVVFLAGGLSQIYRYLRTTAPAQRQQTKWAIFGFVGHVTALLLLVQFLQFSGLKSDSVNAFIYEKYAFAFVGLLPVLFIPLSLTVCILRYRLWDIDLIINRAMVYGILTITTMLLYAVIVGGLSVIFQRGNAVWAFLATGVVAVSFQTIRERIQRAIDRLMYGYRNEPYVVLDRLSQQLAPVLAVDEVLPAIVHTVAQALHLPYVAIALSRNKGFELVAVYADEGVITSKLALATFPLIYQSETIGHLRMAPRGGTEGFSPSELKLLETIARQASIAVYNVRLTSDLQRSREELVTTREEERRRLRRDLHDGLGPVLASMSFRLDAIHNLADHDGEGVKSIGVELKAQLQFSLAEIRRIAYDLRPPALDELGLTGALREYLATMQEEGRPKIIFTAPNATLKLPAAVEVAAYRIILEAVTNVCRHADATTCQVRLDLKDKALYISVADDGVGIAQNHRAGVGLTAMRERAAELGGHCTIVRQAVGSCLEARLPL